MTIRLLALTALLFSLIATDAVGQAPTISGISPTDGPIGTPVTISGSNFNTTPANNTVYFGALKATPSAGTVNSLTVSVPAGATSITPIVVLDNVTGLQASSIETISGTAIRQFTVTNTPTVLLNYARTDIAVGTTPSSVAIGDFNNDNNPDFATADRFADNISIRLGDGIGGFTNAANIDVGVGTRPVSVTTSDFNGDGIDDLAVANADADNVIIYLGNGLGGFSSSSTLALSAPEEINAGDFNGDGNIDLATGRAFTGVSISLGDGLGDFSGTTTFTAGSLPYEAAVGDFNNDGITDLAITNSISSTVSIKIGDGLGAFSGTTNISVGAWPTAIALGDFNEDGNLDFATANFDGYSVSIRLGDGLGGFAATTDIPVGDAVQPYPRDVIVGDFNGDRHSDFATAETNGSGLSIALGDGTGAFSAPVMIAVGNSSTSLATADFNKDGKADIIISNYADGDVSILLWEAYPIFTASTPAENFSENGTGIIFDFDANDGDGGATDVGITFSVVGTDAAAFTISATGELTFTSSPDFENPTDNGADNVYDITVRANNGINDTDIAVAVTVLDALDPFITTWQPTDASITIPTQGTGYNYDISWTNTNGLGNGDGASTGVGNSPFTITGLTPGDIYRVEILGNFPRIYFNNLPGSDEILTVEQWGDIAWGSIMTDAFYGCSALTIPATDAPDLSNVTNMTTFFRNATSFNSDISTWDLSNVNFMSGMFSGATAFNNGGQPLNWGSGASNIINMGGLFEFASTFNQDISDWDVSSVQNMAQMFMGASDFNNANQPLTWSTNGGTANVTSMQNMFLSAASFNQDIGALDVSAVSNMSNMFNSSGLSSANYEAILEGWNSQTLQSGVTLDAPGISYCSPSAVSARANMVATYGWTINDGGVCEPITQANTIVVSGIASTQGPISWSNGNGSDRIVLMREGSPVDTNPTDLTTYTANANFGSGSQIGTANYAVYIGNANNTTVSGLNPETIYHFRVYEYNGTPGTENYFLTSATGNPANTTTLTALTLASNTPAANANNVARNAVIELDFDADVDLLSVNNNSANANEVYDDNIKIFGDQSGQLEGVYALGADNSILQFTPSNTFQAGEQITVTVSSNVLATAGGNAIASSFSFIAASDVFKGAFIEKPSGILGMAEGSFDWGDYNNDGLLDVIVVGYDPSYNHQATIYRNDGGGTFTDIGAGLTGVLFSSADWGDYDNDGDLDLVVAGLNGPPSFTPITTIYRNDGSDTFTNISAGLQGVDYASVEWGDYDNDGDLDLVVIGRYSSGPDLVASTIYQNNNGVFTDIGAGLLPLNNGSANWGDFDADGDLDLLLTGYDADWNFRFSKIYANNNGNFTDHLAGLPGVGYGDASWGDYDNDGDLDVLLLGTDDGALTYTNIYKNEGGVFTDISAGLPATSQGSTRWGDYDGDGNLDLIITGTEDGTGDGITDIFRNEGGDIFTNINAGLDKVSFAGLADFGDFDGDGDLDLLVAGENGLPLAILYENRAFPIFYSKGSGAFDTPALWNSAADGTGVDAVANNFTNGKTDFIIQNGDIITAATAPVSMNNFTIENGGTYENGDQDISVNGATSISGTFSDVITLGESYFYGNLTVELLGSFTASGTNNSSFHFYDNIINRGTFNLANSTAWYIEADLTILNESASAFILSDLNSGTGFINANLTIADFAGGGDVLLRSNDFIRMAANTALRNELGDYPTNSRVCEIAELRATSGTASFENASNAIVLLREDVLGTFDAINFDFTSTDNLVRYFSNGNVLAVDHYHMALTAGATSALLGSINVFGDLTIENLNTLDANGNDITIAGNWINNNASSGFLAGSGAVTFNGANTDPQLITGNTNFNSLVINNTGSSRKVTTNDTIAIASSLALTSGVLEVTNGNQLSLSAAATVSGAFGTSEMIQLAPTATVRKYFDGLGSFTFPIGTANIYNETSLDLTTGTVFNGATGTRYVDLNLVGTEAPNLINSGLSLSKYWTVNSVNLDNISGSLSLTYDGLDATNGDENNYVAATYNGTWSTTAGVDPTTNTIAFNFSGITALDANYTAGELPAFIPIPRIDAFTPTSAASDSTVTITGFNFTNTSIVSFGGTNAGEFTVVSPNIISAKVGTGSSGSVLVTTPEGTTSLAGFTFIPAPVITSFSPLSAASGDTVTILGSNFNDASLVNFGGTAATSFTVVSATEIAAVVGSGASGDISVLTPGGSIAFAGFTFIPAPVITSFSPLSAASGDTVTILGSNFNDATLLSFGGTAATSFTVVSATEIAAVVGSGASGNISVSTPGGSIVFAGFTFIPAPTITSFSPLIAASGDTVTISGSNFNDATLVSFGGTAATSFTVVSDTEIVAVVGSGATGNISVSTPGGSIVFAGFTFIPAPTVSTFDPISAVSGTMVTITGTNFTAASTVTFGGTNAASFTVSSETEINAVVGNGASGSVEVTTPGGTAALAGFTFIPAPTITSFSPTSAVSGATVNIRGTNLLAASTITFGGTNAASFTVVSATEINAVVGDGTSGEVTVTTPDGSAALAGFTYISAPTITSFTPTSAAAGTTVTITGVNLAAATNVFFGATEASSFEVVSNTTLTAVVGNGSSGTISVNTPNGNSALAGFVFLKPQIAVFLGTMEIVANQSALVATPSTAKGNNRTYSFIIRNTGNQDLSISQATSSNNAHLVERFTPLIAPGGQGELVLSLRAGEVGVYNSEISLTSNSMQQAFTFRITAEVLEVNFIIGENDFIILSNDDVNIGATLINVGLIKKFRIQNNSPLSSLEINSITVDNPVFNVLDAPTLIAPLTADEFSIELVSATPGSYRGTLTVATNINDFTFQVIGEVLSEDLPDVEVYNIVTPNGDNRHDFLFIENINLYPNNTVTIFNRWGNTLNTINNYDNVERVFKGITDNGEELLTGNYYYVIDKGNGDKRLKGFFFIQR